VPRLEVEAAVQRRHGRHEQRHGAAGADQPGSGAQLVDVVTKVLEHAHVHHGVERRAGALLQQLLRRDRPGGHAVHAGRPSLELGVHVLGWFDGEHGVPRRGELRRDGAHAGPDLEHGITEVRLDLVADPRQEVRGPRQGGELLGGAELRRTICRLGPQPWVALRPEGLVAAHVAADVADVASYRRQTGGELAEVVLHQRIRTEVPRPERDGHLVDGVPVRLDDGHHCAEEAVCLLGELLVEQQLRHITSIDTERGGGIAHAPCTGERLHQRVAAAAQQRAGRAGTGGGSATGPARADGEPAAVREMTAHEIGDLACVVLPVGVERHHHVGTGVDRETEAIEQRRPEAVTRRARPVERHAEGGGERRRRSRVARTSEQGGRHVDAARRKGPPRLVEFGEHRCDARELVLGRQQHSHQHAAMLAARCARLSA